jgi:hypothetical protein
MPLLSETQVPYGSRLKGRDRRAFSVSTKLTSEEFDSIVRASRDSGKAIGEWARETLLREAHGAPRRLSNEHLMIELAGVQLLLMNALLPIVCGETMSRDWYVNLTRQVRESKHEAAKVVIEKHLTNRQKSNPV